jgi:hypothetical protein
VEKVDWAPHAVVFPVDESVKLLATIHRRSKRTRSATPRLVSRKPRKRWGSCDAAGNVRLNWRAMQVAPRLVDYIVAHELVHLEHRRHRRCTRPTPGPGQPVATTWVPLSLRAPTSQGPRRDDWASKADDLLRGASSLRQRTPFLDRQPSSLDAADFFPGTEEWSLHLAMLMLRAFAVECLIKATWLQQGGLLFQNGRYKGVDGDKGHDLVALARRVGIELGAEEADALERLSDYAVGPGRYPLPSSVEKTAPRSNPAGGTRPRSYWGPADEFPLEQLVQRLRDTLRTSPER